MLHTMILSINFLFLVIYIFKIFVSSADFFSSCIDVFHIYHCNILLSVIICISLIYLFLLSIRLLFCVEFLRKFIYFIYFFFLFCISSCLFHFFFCDIFLMLESSTLLVFLTCMLCSLSCNRLFNIDYHVSDILNYFYLMIVQMILILFF